MKQIMEEKAQNYKNGKITDVTENVVKDSTITLTINNKIKRSLSAIEDSLKEFAVGYLFNENMVKTLEDIEKIEIDGNKINVEINDTLLKTKETVLCSDSAGGWRSKINNIEPVTSNFQVKSDELIERIEELKNNAQIWQATGGTHVAGIVYKDNFIVKEDVSRHVVVDKVIGAAFKSEYDLTQSYITYSGRMPADMLIKVIRVGIPIIISNAAPAASGYEIAKKGNITMVGFVRNNRFNLYSAPQRINLEK